MGSQIEQQFRQFCFDCRKAKSACLCHELKPFKTETFFVILMHPKEAKKERVGTGRITHQSLINSKIIVDEKFDDNPLVRELLDDSKYQPYILYPGKNALSLEQEKPLTFDHTENKKLLIFVIDGTWSCAKTMMRESLCLHNLPRISFTMDDITQSRFSIKQQPSNYCLSTIESVYKVLQGLKNWGVESFTEKQHENLLYLLEKMCEFQKQCAANPALQRYRPGHFKKRETISVSKKWKSRKIYFEVH